MNCVAGDEKHLLNAGSGGYILLFEVSYSRLMGY